MRFDVIYICPFSLQLVRISETLPKSNAVAMLNVPPLLPPIAQNSDRRVEERTHRPLAVLVQAHLVSLPVVRDLERHPAVADLAIAVAAVPSPCDDCSAVAADNIQETLMHPLEQGSRDFQRYSRQCRPCSRFRVMDRGSRHLRRRGSKGGDLRGSWRAIR